jgi:hypothetical protein
MAAWFCSRDTSAKQGSISFLKKRNKKLLPLLGKCNFTMAGIESNKSFLVLFFKKELLPCTCLLG